MFAREKWNANDRFDKMKARLVAGGQLCKNDISQYIYEDIYTDIYTDI